LGLVLTAPPRKKFPVTKPYINIRHETAEEEEQITKLFALRVRKYYCFISSHIDLSEKLFKLNLQILMRSINVIGKVVPVLY